MLSDFSFQSKLFETTATSKEEFCEDFEQILISDIVQDSSSVFLIFTGHIAPIGYSNGELCYILNEKGDTTNDILSHRDINELISNIQLTIPVILFFNWNSDISPFPILTPDTFISPNTFLCFVCNKSCFPNLSHSHILLYSIYDVLRKSPEDTLLLVEFYAAVKEHYLNCLPQREEIYSEYIEDELYTKNTLRSPLLIKTLSSNSSQSLPSLFFFIIDIDLIFVDSSTSLVNFTDKIKYLFRSMNYIIGENVILTDRGNLDELLSKNRSLNRNQTYRSLFIIVLSKGGSPYRVKFAEESEVNVDLFTLQLAKSFPKIPKIIFFSQVRERSRVVSSRYNPRRKHTIIVHSIESASLTDNSLIYNFALELKKNYSAELHEVLRSSIVYSTQSFVIQVMDGFTKNFYLNYHSHIYQILEEKSDEFKETFLKACQEGIEPFKFYRLMVIGPEGVGKTSLLRILTGKSLQKDEKSTAFIKKYDMHVQKLTHDWSEMEDLDKYIQNIEETQQNLAMKIAAQMMIQTHDNLNQEQYTSPDSLESEEPTNTPIGLFKKSKHQNVLKEIKNAETIEPTIPQKEKQTNTHKDQLINQETNIQDNKKTNTQEDHLINQETDQQTNTQNNKKTHTQEDHLIKQETDQQTNTQEDHLINQETDQQTNTQKNKQRNTQRDQLTNQQTDQLTNTQNEKQPSSQETYIPYELTDQLTGPQNESVNVVQSSSLVKPSTSFTLLREDKEQSNFEQQTYDLNHFENVREAVDKIRSLRCKTDFFTAWDFAGQNYLYCFHSLFLSPRSVYLLLVDLSIKDLTSDVEVRHRDDRHDERSRSGVPRTYLQVYEFWLNAIYSVSKTLFKGSFYSTSKVVLVFSKADQVENPEEIARKYWDSIKLHMSEKNNAFSLVHEEDELFILSCDPKCKYYENVSKLKTTIKWLSDQVAFEEPIPIKWLTLANRILKEKLPIINMPHIKYLAEKFNCSKDLHHFLHFFNDIGFFFYKKGKIIVVVDNFLSLIYSILFPKFIKLKTKSSKDRLQSIETDIKMCTKEGMLTLNLYEHILDCLDMYALRQPLLELLLVYGILIRCDSQLGYSDVFYVPYLLTGSLKDIVQQPLFPPHNLQSTFFLYFPDGFLPASLYFTLLSNCLRKSEEKGFSRSLLGFDCAIFYVCKFLLVSLELNPDGAFIAVTFSTVIDKPCDEKYIYSEILNYLIYLQLTLVEIQSTLISCGNLAKVMFVCNNCKTFSQLEEGMKPTCSLDTVLSLNAHEKQVPDKFQSDIPGRFCCDMLYNQISLYINQPDIILDHICKTYNNTLLAKLIVNHREMFAKHLNWRQLSKTFYSYGLITVQRISTIINEDISLDKRSEEFLLEMVHKGPLWAIKFYFAMCTNSIEPGHQFLRHFLDEKVISFQKGDIMETPAVLNSLPPNPPTSYIMDRKPHGIAFIVNIKSFTKGRLYKEVRF